MPFFLTYGCTSPSSLASDSLGPCCLGMDTGKGKTDGPITPLLMPSINALMAAPTLLRLCTSQPLDPLIFQQEVSKARGEAGGMH